MRPLALALLALLLLACEDVDFRATPTPAAGAVILASTDQRFAEVPTAVAGVTARREQAGGPVTIVATPRPTPLAAAARPATPVPTAVAGIAARRGTPTLDRRAAATATVRAALGRVVRAGVAEESRARTSAGALPGTGGADAAGQIGAGELARAFAGLPRDDARCSELALAERGLQSRREAGLPVAGSAQTEILLQQLEAGCFPEGADLTPELARALAARPPAPGGVGAGADGLGVLGRPATDTLADRDRAADRAGAVDPFARDELGPAGAPLPPRDPFLQDRPVTSRPPFRDTLRSATGTGP